MFVLHTAADINHSFISGDREHAPGKKCANEWSGELCGACQNINQLAVLDSRGVWTCYYLLHTEGSDS